MKNKIINWITADYKRLLFIIISVAILIIMPVMAKDAGMSGDEPFHFQQAENVVNFYKTFGKDSAAIVTNNNTQGDNLYEYGQLPDNISYLVASTLNIDDILSVRHFVNSIFGWLGILFAGLLAYRVSKNWLAAIITSLLLFLSPGFLGHSLNNLKDLPFAAIMLMGVYYITCFYQTFPKPSKKACIMVAVSIGLALAIRVGGLLLIAYLGLFGLIFFMNEMIKIRKQTKNKKEKSQKFSTLFLRLLIFGVVISLAGYIIGILLWPYALVSPVKNVMATFATMSQFGAALRQLFEGSLQWSDILPWYYTPKLIMMTIPTAVITGIFLFLIFIWKDKKNYFYYFIIFFAFFFPVYWIVYTNANVYGGWRHSLFTYPPMVVAAGLGFNLAIEWITQKIMKKEDIPENI